jgi:hypothetical protein
MFEKQPDLVELRVVDGGHNWQTWSGAVDSALTYLFRFAARPTIAARTPNSGFAQHLDKPHVTP